MLRPGCGSFTPGGGREVVLGREGSARFGYQWLRPLSTGPVIAPPSHWRPVIPLFLLFNILVDAETHIEPTELNEMSYMQSLEEGLGPTGPKRAPKENGSMSV